MSNLSHEKILLNDNINDIFEQKIEVGAVIQFDLLQRLIEEFIKRQKSLNDKVNNLELLINSSSGPFNITVIDENKLDESKTSLEYKTSKEIIIKEKENNNDNKKLIVENIVKPEKEEKQVKQEKIKSEDDNKIEQHNKKELIQNQYRILSSRFDKFEKNLNELTKKVNKLNETEPHDEKNEIYDKLIKKQDEKIEKLENDINYINQKIKEMNIIQVEYSNDNKEESEENKNKNAQIMKMLTKKIDLMENKSKKNDEDVFKLRKDLTEINNLLSKDKNTYNEYSNEINKNYNKFIVAVNKDIKSLKNLMSEKDEKIKNDLTNKFETENNNIKKMIDELKNNINAYIEDNIIENILKSSTFNEKLNGLKKDFKDLMKQNIAEIEKNKKSIINSLGIENIQKQLSSIQENLKEKLIKSDLDYIDLKLKDLENRSSTQSSKLDDLEKDLMECNNAYTKSVRMLEYLSGHVIPNDEPEKKIEKKEEINKNKNMFTLEEKDLHFFVNKEEFNEEIKKLYAKIEQILLVESENYKFIQYVESRLKYFVTQKDFKLMEKCLINMIEDLKINFARKYMEKSEILKNIKLLEIQLKNLQDSNPGMVKEGDNWLLAKKPMNNYLCASCEAYIGELKNNNTYLAWNKIPPHDINTKYRMGNGFSRMLELVNTDIIKNAEKINNNLIIKVDEKKINYDNIYPLPRVGSQVNLKKLNNKLSTFYANNENIEKKLNNSMDGLDNNNELNTPLKNNKKGRNKNLRQTSDGKFLSDFGAVTSSYDRDFNYPQVLKIIKKTKKDI